MASVIGKERGKGGKGEREKERKGEREKGKMEEKETLGL